MSFIVTVPHTKGNPQACFCQVLTERPLCLTCAHRHFWSEACAEEFF